MWPFYPAPRRKSSVSSPPTSPMTARGGPVYASAIAESPDFPTSPQFARDTGHLHPRTPSSPHLEGVHEDPSKTGATNASAVSASGGSKAPLLSKDFAKRPMVDRIDEQDTGTMSRDRGENHDEYQRSETTDTGSSVPTLKSPLTKKAKDKIRDPLLVPPPSVHDYWVSSIISPMAPVDSNTQPSSPAANDDRPPVLRTASAPGIPASKTQLLPSPLPNGKSKQGTGKDAIEEGTPILEIFDADLNGDARQMVKALKTHLEEVLRVQEEIGRMHLSLERLNVVAPGAWDDFDNKLPGRRTSEGRVAPNGTPSTDGTTSTRRGSSTGHGTSDKGTPSSSRSKGQETPGGKAKLEAEEALHRREKGVDDIMKRLGTLSDNLRTYHKHGTPRLSFPQAASNTPVATSEHKAFEAIPEPSSNKTPRRAPESPKEKGVSPPHITVANLRGQTLPPSPLHQVRGRSESSLEKSAFSRSMTTLEETNSDELDGRYDPYGAYDRRSSDRSIDSQPDAEEEPETRKKNSNLSPLSLRDDAPRTGLWSGWGFGATAREQGKDREEHWHEHDSARTGESSRREHAQDRRQWVDSPLEMMDRSRPW